MKNLKFWISFFIFTGGLNATADTLSSFSTSELIEAKAIAEQRIQILKQYNDLKFGTPANSTLKEQRRQLRILQTSAKPVELSLLQELSAPHSLSTACVDYAKALRTSIYQLTYLYYWLINSSDKNDFEYLFYKNKMELVQLQTMSLLQLFENQQEGGNSPLLKTKTSCHWKNKSNLQLEIQIFSKSNQALQTTLFGQEGATHLMKWQSALAKSSVEYFDREKRLLIPKMALSAVAGTVGLSLLKSYPLLKVALKSSYGLYWGLKTASNIRPPTNSISESEKIVSFVNWTRQLEKESSLNMLEVLEKIKAQQFSLMLQLLEESQREFSFIDSVNSQDQQKKIELKLAKINSELSTRKD